MYLRTRLTVVVVTLVCLAAGPTSAGDALRIGVSIALSGRYAAFGRMYADGLRLWEREENAKGGILGRRVDLIVHDDGGEPDRAVEIYRGMLSSKRFDFVFGPYSSLVSKAVVPLLEKYRYPTMMPMASCENVWEGRPRYVFGLTTPERRCTRAIFAIMAGCGIDRLVILVDESLLRLGSPRDAEKWAGRLGLRILLLELLDKRKIVDQLRRAHQTGAQALLVWGYLDDAATVRRALDDIGWTPKIFFSQVAPSLEEYGRVLGRQADYSLGCCGWDPEIGRFYPGGIEFVKAFSQEYGCAPSYQAANGYAAGVILSQAILRAGNTDREKIREILASLDIVTLIGRYGVDEEGVQIRQRPIIYQWQNGRRRVIWPKSFSNASLQFPPETRP